MMSQKLNFPIPKDLYAAFQKAIIDKYGMLKGNMAQSVEEALRDWVQKVKEAEEK
jgi:hypothetical protein